LEFSHEFAPRNEKEKNQLFLKKAALLEDPDAQYELGIRLALGLGICAEPNQGIEWLRKAGFAGQPDAQFALGYIHDEGVVVGRNLETAIIWYKKTAESGNTEAKYNLARCHHLQGNHYIAFRLWTEIAKTQDHRSLNNVGTYLALGIATDKDNHAAADIFRKANKNGYVVAEYNLGICYEFGHGVAQSNATAYMHIESTARRGYPQAQYHLADCYLTGRIVGTKNHSLALKLLNMARERMTQSEVLDKTYSLDLRLQGPLSSNCRNDWAKRTAELGDIDAQCYLGLCYAYGTRETGTDYPQAIKWLTMAAMSDDVTAQFVLGCLHNKGLGTKRDAKRAAEWHRLAAINGLKHSKLITAYNYHHGKGVVKSEIEAYAYYCSAEERYKSAFLERNKYDWKDFAAGERRAHVLKQEMAAKRKTREG
jgi:TPR repeat protein